MDIDEEIQRLKQARAPVGLREFTRVALHFGYSLNHITGSHHVFRNWSGRKFVVPVHRNKIKALYARNFIKEQG